jgi:hypothetical protein
MKITKVTAFGLLKMQSCKEHNGNYVHSDMDCNFTVLFNLPQL